MARPQRLFLPGHPHHVIQRGHNQGPIFLDDDDRRSYLHHLGEVARESRVAVHAYALGKTGCICCSRRRPLTPSAG
jgi:putative transposase